MASKFDADLPETLTRKHYLQDLPKPAPNVNLLVFTDRSNFLQTVLNSMSKSCQQTFTSTNPESLIRSSHTCGLTTVTELRTVQTEKNAEELRKRLSGAISPDKAAPEVGWFSWDQLVRNYYGSDYGGTKNNPNAIVFDADSGPCDWILAESRKHPTVSTIIANAGTVGEKLPAVSNHLKRTIARETIRNAISTSRSEGSAEAKKQSSADRDLVWQTAYMLGKLEGIAECQAELKRNVRD